MINRLITAILALSLVSASLWADEEHDIIFERGNYNAQDTTFLLPYGIITFNLEGDENFPRVRVSMESTAISQTLLLFKHSESENTLKKNEPKIEFEKTYPGSKENRRVYGCKDLQKSIFVLLPQEKVDLLDMELNATSAVKLGLPVYSAKYVPKKLFKKESYKILSKDSLFFRISIKGWSENDPEYVSTKAAVEEYLRSLQGVSFCKNKKHSPSLSRQMKPYETKRDSLVAVINKVLADHKSDNNWMSDLPPHKAYDALLTQLKNVDLNKYKYDCGVHKSQRGDHGCIPPPKPKPRHECGYCSLSAAQVYHQLDDIYQQLRVGKLAKGTAASKARQLNTCYQKCATRKKDSVNTAKISKFYKKISGLLK